jgi:hypothetical protein
MTTYARDYRIVNLATGVSGLSNAASRVAALLSDQGGDPYPAPFTPATIVGTDGNGHPIEGGWPSCDWVWDYLPLDDFDVMDDFVGDNPWASVFIRTMKRDGTYSNYKAVMWRPLGDPLGGNRRSHVVIHFTRLELQS